MLFNLCASIQSHIHFSSVCMFNIRIGGLMSVINVNKRRNKWWIEIKWKLNYFSSQWTAMNGLDWLMPFQQSISLKRYELEFKSFSIIIIIKIHIACTISNQRVWFDHFQMTVAFPTAIWIKIIMKWNNFPNRFDFFLMSLIRSWNKTAHEMDSNKIELKSTINEFWIFFPVQTAFGEFPQNWRMYNIFPFLHCFVLQLVSHCFWWSAFCALKWSVIWIQNVH